MDQYIDYKDEWGAPMPHVPEQLEKPVKIYEGNIFTLTGEDSRRRHYSIEHVEDKGDVECEVTLREIRPQGYKALLLASALIGAWYLLDWATAAMGF